MKKLICFLIALTVLSGCINVFADYSVPYGTVVDSPNLKNLIKKASREDSNLLYPPQEHPYVFVNSQYIENLKQNKNDISYADNYKYILDMAEKQLPEQPEGGFLSAAISRQLEARAFMFVMGEVNRNSAKETVEYTIEYIKNAKSRETYSISIYKDFGTQAIQTGSLVYDWCYSIMTESQKMQLSELIKNLVYDPVQPSRPDNMSSWRDMAGYNVGQPLIYNSIAASALYDVYPEMYEAIMPKIQGGMADAVKLYGEAGALSDGSLAYCREYYTYHVAVLFQRMGYNIDEIYGNQLPIGYKVLYSRLPYGAIIKQGDDFYQANYKIGQYLNGVETKYNLGILSALYGDGYLKFQYAKENYNLNGLMDFLVAADGTEVKLPDELPLAFEVYEPRAEIMARTSWQDGLNAPTVSAYMNMNNRRTGDHDHSDIGQFQLYYKGPLTMPAGSYDGGGWGDSHWRNYYSRSISNNTMSVYDPDEVFISCNNDIAEANDGGQRMARGKNGGLVSDSEHLTDYNLWSKVEGTYIGPNAKTPAFSYIKGDLTTAYNANKMENYKRSMVFMDTFNADYPGVMIVFDRVVSKNPSFRKAWNLQAVTEPQISGNKITIVNTEDGCNGKLVNTTLLPEKQIIDKVGGVGKYVVGDNEYPADLETTASLSYKGGWRAEVSPANASKEDLFLNAMYVTDADGNAPELPMIFEEMGNFVGVTALDRTVLFSKDGNSVGAEFSVEISDNNSGKDMLCMIADVEPGKWIVSGNGKEMVLQSLDGDGCLVFSAKAGIYTIKPVENDVDLTDIFWAEADKPKIGDFIIKVDTTYANAKYENKLVNGIPYFAAESFIEYHIGADVTSNNNTLTAVLNGKTFSFTAGNKSFTVSGEKPGELKYAPFVDENGIFYINLDGTETYFGLSGTYIPKAKLLKFDVKKQGTAISGSATGQLVGVDEANVLMPVAISASSDDGNLPEHTIDRNLSTRWSSNVADGEWICFDLGEEKSISNVQIAFYNGDKRNWKFDIQISNDGFDFTTVLPSQKSSGKTKEVETFTLPAGTKARYVRYLGHGEEVTGGFYNSLTQFIINKEK